MRFSARSHPGRRGGRNEDAVGWDEAHGVWFVADGMGGHASGDVASRIVKQALLEHAAAADLRATLLKAHEAVFQAAALTTVHNNMGSTAVLARIANQHAHIAWVGDSRAYLWRDQSLRQLTRDHSFLEVLREQEKLSEAQLRGHPNKNLVTQTLGIGTPEPSLVAISLRRGDCLLLCSDGLNDELEDQEIAAVLRAHPSPEAAVPALIEAALARGGRDNVSAVVVEYDDQGGLSVLRTPAQSLRAVLPIIMGVLAALLVAFLWWSYGR
jgi:PPM family protein phosphatase